MSVTSKQGLAGFSAGIGLYFKRFSVDYGFIVYSSAGYNNLLTLTTNLDKWRK
jgi:predicted NAD/FAD-binding protein